MEDTTRLTNEQAIKLFIQRDYSEGTMVKFHERFPRELEGKVKNFLFFILDEFPSFLSQIDPSKFVDILQHINRIFAKAESISCRAFTENCCACLTGYLILLCIPTYYQRVCSSFQLENDLSSMIFSVLKKLENISMNKINKHSIQKEFSWLIQWKKVFVV